jgi:predicted Zn-dependent protease
MQMKTMHLSCAKPVLAIVLSVSTLLFSCKKEETITKPQAAEGEIASLTSYLTDQGFKAEDILFKDGNFIIHDDILISREDLTARVKDKSNSDVPQTEQWRSPYRVNVNYNNNIKIYIEPSVPAAWKTAVKGAVANWNAVTSTRLAMSIVTTKSEAHTRIFMGSEDANWVARAVLPTSSGKPGTTVEINSHFNSMAASQKLFAITHEFGHTVGYLHTDQTNGIFISGTPAVDAKSVMNSYVLAWAGFTAGDIKAIRLIYPL